jgi:hypothetical protein
VKKAPKRSELKRQFHRLAVAQADVASAKDAWLLLQKNPSHIGTPTHTALITAIVICYSRPFTDNESFGKLPKEWSTYSNIQFRRCHDAILTARNEVIAHRDKAVHQIRIYPPGIKLKFQPKSAPPLQHIGFSVDTYSLASRDLQALGDMFDDLQKRMMAEIEIFIEKLYGGMESELPNRDFPLRIDEGL